MSEMPTWATHIFATRCRTKDSAILMQPYIFTRHRPHILSPMDPYVLQSRPHTYSTAHGLLMCDAILGPGPLRCLRFPCIGRLEAGSCDIRPYIISISHPDPFLIFLLVSIDNFGKGFSVYRILPIMSPSTILHLYHPLPIYESSLTRIALRVPFDREYEVAFLGKLVPRRRARHGFFNDIGGK